MTERIWLSFADDKGFRGIAIVDLDGGPFNKEEAVVAAISKTISLGINPGPDTSVLGSVIPPEDHIPDKFRNRLLSEFEAEQVRRLPREIETK
jgi:hypothetical protein